MLTDIVVAALAGAPGVAGVAVLPGVEALWQELSSREIGVVIVPGEKLSGGALSRLLRANPSVRFVLVHDGGLCGSTVELWPHSRALGELSPDRLRSAVGEVASWGARFAGSPPEQGATSP